MSFSERFKKTLKNAAAGRNLGIPFHTEKLNKALGGITPATYYLALAESNTGKTRIIYTLFWWYPLEYMLTDTVRKEGDLEVFVFSLEMPEEKSLAIAAARWLNRNKKSELSDADIMGMQAVPSEETQKLSNTPELVEYLDMLDRHTTFIETSDGETILRTVRDYCLANSEKIGTGKDNKPIYEFKNKNKMVIVIIDHIGNIYVQGKPQHEAIKFVSNGLIVLRNMFGITPVVIQQVNPGEDKPVLIPTHKQTRESKAPFIDCDTSFGIGNPFKLEIPELKYKGGTYYIIPTAENQGRGVGNRLRMIGTGKVRYGDLTLRLPLYFHGAYCKIEDMPPPDKINYKLFK